MGESGDSNKVGAAGAGDDGEPPRIMAKDGTACRSVQTLLPGSFPESATVLFSYARSYHATSKGRSTSRTSFVARRPYLTASAHRSLDRLPLSVSRSATKFWRILANPSSQVYRTVYVSAAVSHLHFAGAEDRMEALWGRSAVASN